MLLDAEVSRLRPLRNLGELCGLKLLTAENGWDIAKNAENVATVLCDLQGGTFKLDHQSVK
jgi:hypothetical protein